MLPSGLQILLRPRVTLSLDLLTDKLVVTCPCPVDHLCQFAATLVHPFSKYRVQ